jgi:hypothetical protein
MEGEMRARFVGVSADHSTERLQRASAAYIVTYERASQAQERARARARAAAAVVASASANAGIDQGYGYAYAADNQQHETPCSFCWKICMPELNYLKMTGKFR